ncbi:MAG: DNA-processing protein DprA [Anaeromicrobium sp.]|jgi:DNA processing protein|uniref:DNA-processing protein DprA n=1 Tax=Anaeromicrobium sp. TaxID=1929132 RepID=UPI0025F32C84|nr:DNA-processing protein DprA [Anaeromicrobium sp.]MCT4595571.1 DNA-processing protein DprA [Anaeromicrobium sp.]
MYKEEHYVAWLHSIDGIGNATLRKILKKDCAKDIYDGNVNVYKEKFNLKEKVVENIIIGKKKNKLEKLGEIIHRNNISVISIKDKKYPDLLRNIYNPPAVLYVRGSIEKEKCDIISIIGSRRASTYGKTMAYKISKELSHKGIIIISGMARGIDTIAHKACVENGGITYGILGTGVDICYPYENRLLMEKIIENGAVISEFPIGTKPIPGNFPRRNRIISGMAKGVVVIEAALKSGTLITVDYALEQGREVFALPGNVTALLSGGTNKLIQNGAKLVTGVDDILEELQLENICDKNKKEVSLSDSEKEIYEYIKDNQPVSIEKIEKDKKWNIQNISTILTFLELKGVLETLPGNKFFIK